MGKSKGKEDFRRSFIANNRVSSDPYTRMGRPLELDHVALYRVAFYSRSSNISNKNINFLSKILSIFVILSFLQK